uniref:Uncharacterized protein n=1 Tax=Paramormyrops kingsleyae TaxID=1676925 RepID=A0A3B3T9N0_9TELE
RKSSSGSAEMKAGSMAWRKSKPCVAHLPEGTNTCSSWGLEKGYCRTALGKMSRPGGRGLTFRSILAKPSPLDARSLASWKSSLRERLVSITEPLSSALSQNSSPLRCSPASRKSPVDLSSIPAMSLLPDWASPPRM